MKIDCEHNVNFSVFASLVSEEQRGTQAAS